LVIISNGFNKFHLSVAAVEAAKREMLTKFITGAYPTPGVLRAARRLQGRRSRVERLLARKEDIPTERISALLWPEILNDIAIHGPAFLRRPALSVWAMRLYARRAVRAVHQAAKNGARIYHYRAGFGHESVRAAKRLGLVTVCDHSIAHPGTLHDLVNNNGRMPAGPTVPEEYYWRQVLDDIELADFVLVNSDFVKETFLNQGFPSSRVETLYWGVDDQFLREVRRHSRTKHTTGPLRFLFAGSVDKRKGANVLIAAFARVNDLDWTLTLSGPIAGDIARDHERFLHDKRVNTPGNILRSELARVMTSSEVFIFPSLAEGSARAVFEAMSAGCYIITTRNSGSIVEDGIHGTIVPPGDVAALEIAIRDAFRQRERLQHVGLQNAHLVSTRYDQSKYGDGLEAYYCGLLPQSPGRPRVSNG